MTTAAHTPLPSAPRRYTLDEYVALDAASDVRLEFWDGHIVSMAGGTTDHAVIGFNVITAIGGRLRGHRCRGYSNDQQIVVPGRPFRFYPDLSVICGPVGRDASDPGSRAATNPTLIVEVLSPTTEADDRGRKFAQYLLLESLQEYVLVSQDGPRVETFYRQPGGTWLFTPTTGRDAAARLRSLDVDLPLAEVYDGVAFPPPA